jgi:hypothetical protein
VKRHKVARLNFLRIRLPMFHAGGFTP